MVELGAALGTHRLRLVGKLAGIVLWIAISVFLVWFVRDAKPTSTILAWSVVGVSCVATVVLIIGFLRACTVLVTRHEHGIAWRRAGHDYRVRLDELAHAEEWSHGGKPIVLVLQLRGGGEHRIPSNVVDHETLIAHVCGKRVATALPTAVVVSRPATPSEPGRSALRGLEDIG